jgi:hypothetical protein
MLHQLSRTARGVVRYDVDLAARTFVKMDGTWLFAERKLYVDWPEQRELS